MTEFSFWLNYIFKLSKIQQTIAQATITDPLKALLTSTRWGQPNKDHHTNAKKGNKQVRSV